MNPTLKFAITLVPLVFGATAYQYIAQRYGVRGFHGSRAGIAALAICAVSVIAAALITWLL